MSSPEHTGNNLRRNIQYEIEKLSGLNLNKINAFCKSENVSSIYDIDLLSEKFMPKRKGNLTLVSDPEILQEIAEGTLKTLRKTLSEFDQVINLDTFTRYWTFSGTDKNKFFVTEHYPEDSDSYDVVQAYITREMPAEYERLLDDMAEPPRMLRKIMHGLIQG